MTSNVAWGAIYRAPSARRAASFLAAALVAVLLLCQPARAAHLQWEALPDRERVTITMGPSEGMAGKVGRIAPTGILIPFADVPPGLLLDKTPEGAVIFEGTRQLGRALALLTQSPEFGFVVSKQEPTILVIDFFHNPLGARWKATAPATTTEIAPEVGLGPMAQADAATQALESDPQGRSEASAAALAATETAEAAAASAAVPAEAGTVPAAVPDQDSPATAEAAPATEPASPATSASPQAVTAPPDPERPKPMVVQLSGTPDHASKVTRMAEAPLVETPSSAMLPPGSAKNATAANATAVFAPRQ
ncbi:hypothetical protein LJC15_06075, partial [Desulfovibrio sp. OttesenSCG-928-G11]|nr:hypothetical protein [Desulfovibrio sp. OttesenSCG-928-G11]